MNNFIIKSNIIYSKTKDELNCFKDSFVVCENGISKGVFEKFDSIPEIYKNFKILDYSNFLLTPGLNDIHIHACQYAFIGLHMDLELLDWLQNYTFPEEAKYEDTNYAKKAYSIFISQIKKSSTTRFVSFATMHLEASLILCDLIEESKLKAYIGKVNMNRNAPANLCEESTKKSIEDTKEFIKKVEERKYKNVNAIITPRFIPSCTSDLLKALGEISKEYHLAIQSHLVENPEEVSWVKELEPKSRSYADAYHMYNLFGENERTIMAHCVFPTELDEELLQNGNVWVAHAPSSNSNIRSGIAPIRRFLNKNIKVGLATDVAGGSTLDMWDVIRESIQVSKLRFRYVDDTLKPLSANESFYLATKGGGSFFGKVGSFDEGYEFDALILDDFHTPSIHQDELTLDQRLERYIYISSPENLVHKFVNGEMIF